MDAGKRRFLIFRAVLLLASIAAYWKDPDDVVWRYIKAAPHVRMWEHICFGIAATALGFSLWLRVRAEAEILASADISARSSRRKTLGEFLQAVGIGSLLPWSGFLLLVSGETILAFLDHRRIMRVAAKGTGINFKAAPVAHSSVGTEWKDLFRQHAGLLCAFLSMVLFSVTLLDRVADVLFAGTALVSVLTSFKRRKHFTAGF